jgi:hypothetical protein
MQLPWIRFTTRSMMVGVTVVALACWAIAHYQRWSYYDSGWWEAEREIWRGELTIYGYVGGGGGFSDICRIDRGTGLLITSFSACVREPGEDQQIRGHNDHVMQYIRWRGLPGYSLKRWEKELFELASYFDIRSQLDTPRTLSAGGPVLIAPDGKARVQPVAGRGYDGSLSDDLLDLVISAPDAVVGKPCIRFLRGHSDLVWGPPGSQTVVVLTSEAHRESFAAYGLWSGVLLRKETWVRDDDGVRRERENWILDPLPEDTKGDDVEDTQLISVGE